MYTGSGGARSKPSEVMLRWTSRMINQQKNSEIKIQNMRVMLNEWVVLLRNSDALKVIDHAVGISEKTHGK